MKAFASALPSSIVLLAGCALTSPAPAHRPLYPGDAYGRASLESLPALDVADTELTKEMRVARMLSAESLNLPDPAQPPGTSAEAIQVWSDQVLRPWVAEKHQRAAAARAELDRAAVQNHRQRIMAGALVGLLYEDVARVLMSVPVPDDLKDEPEIAKICAEMTTSHALPYLTQAKLAYVACAKNAVQPETMNHWSGFCQGRADRLPQVGDGPKQTAEEGTRSVTEVSVVTE